MAIRDQGYTRYEGDLTAGSPTWWVVASNGFSLQWAYVRSKLLLFPILFVFLLFVFATFGERVLTNYFMSGQPAAQPDEISGFYEFAFGYVQIWILALYFTASGCGVIAEDLRFKTIQLYFSKPITKTDYIVGKFMSLVMFGGLVTVLPTILVGGIRMMIFAPSESFGSVALKVGGVVAYDIVLLCLFSLIVMALSALTSRTGYVVLAWAGFMLIPSLVSTIVDLVRKGEEWPELLSVAGTMGLALQSLVDFKGIPQPGQLAPAPPPDYMMWAPWLIIVALGSAAVGVLYWRTSKLEGIA